METRHIPLEKPIEITVAIRPNDQVVGAYLEHVKVDTVFQYAIDDYGYHAIAEIGNERHTIQAKSNRFMDNSDDLSYLEWTFLTGRVLPTIINRARIEWHLEEVDKR